MARRRADGFVRTFNPQVQNIGVLVDELGGDEVAVAGYRCRARANFANGEVGRDAVFREIDEDRAADLERLGQETGQNTGTIRNSAGRSGEIDRGSCDASSSSNSISEECKGGRG